MHDHSKHTSGHIKTAFFLNLSFTFIEIIGGMLTNSVAVIADAIHDAGDSVSLGFAWYLQRLSTQKSTDTFTFGYRRFSLLGALLNAAVLLVGSVLMLYTAIPRIFFPQATDAQGMILLAILGILVNGIAAFRMRKTKNLNEKVVSLHLVEDVLGWVAVLIVAIMMHFYRIPILDPIMSVLIAVFVFVNALRNGKKALRIFLQTSPDDCNIVEIQHQILNLTAVKNIHDVHFWSMDGEYHVLSLHVVVEQTTSIDTIPEIKNQIRLIANQQGISHVTVEIELESEHCIYENGC